MKEQSYEVVFRGTRGSRCATGIGFSKYGGNTSCLEVPLADRHRLLLDCGSGLRNLAADLPDPAPTGRLRFDVLLSHYHQDHIEGLPLFDPLYHPDCRFTFYGTPWQDRGVGEILSGILAPPWFPIPFSRTASAKEFVDLTGDPIHLENLSIRMARLCHPQGVTAFRLDHPGGSLVYATDVECGDEKLDGALIELAAGADVLVHDAQFTPEDYEAYRGRGHSSWGHAVAVAHTAGVQRLVLFHHDPDRTDDQVDAILERARAEFPGAMAAKEGDRLSF